MNKGLIITENATILEALNMIDTNHKGFLVVVNNDMAVCGTLTDGDIRRALILGSTVADAVSSLPERVCTTILVDSPVSDAVKAFSNEKISFLPIVNRNNKLVNILTEQQLKYALLHNLQFDLHYDFSSLDESVLRHSVVAKPWGFYHTTVINEFYQSKVISLAPNSSLSLQVHKLREEYWVVVSGSGEAQIGDSFKHLTAGAFVFIPKNCIHRLYNKSQVDNLIVFEVQIGESFDESDIERLCDEYNR